MKDIRAHYQDVVFPLRTAVKEAEDRIADYLKTIDATSEEVNNEALKKGKHA